jgi:hypothetical protein
VNHLLLAATLFVAVSTPHSSAAAAEPAAIAGLWDAVIVASNVDVPFRFEIAVRGTAVEGSFF